MDPSTRDDEQTMALDVAVRPVGGGPRSDRSARVAALTTIGVALAIVLFALPKGEAADPIRPGVNQAAQASPASPTRVRPTAAPRTARPTLQPLPEVLNQVLDGAPHPAFYERRRDDLVIRQWVPGSTGLEVAATIVDAFADLPIDAAVTQPSPDGRAVMIMSFWRPDGEPTPVRLATDTGGIAWEGTATIPSDPVWSVDSRFVALIADEGSWWLIDTAANPPGVLQVPVPPSPAAPDASPGTGRPILPGERPVPIGFAADVSYLYGATTFTDDGTWRSPIRIAVDTGVVEPIEELPASGPQAPASRIRGLLPEPDPITGRTALFEASGPVVRGPDGSVAFRPEVTGTILFMAWSENGRLITVETEGRDEVGTVRVTPWTPAGVQEAPLLVSSHPAWVPLIEHRDGHLLMGFVTDSAGASNNPLRLVLLRLDDGATATVDIETDAMPGLSGLGWYEPRDRIAVRE